MSPSREVNERDLRMRSREIMDAVERGESFTITRDGCQIGELIPLRSRKRFVSREAFARGSRHAPVIDPDRWRADIDSAVDPRLDDPFERAGW